MVQFSLILHHNMGIKCAEDPFNMGMFFDIRPPSLWVHFQTPNTHIRAFHTGVAPPGFPPTTQPRSRAPFPTGPVAVRPSGGPARDDRDLLVLRPVYLPGVPDNSHVGRTKNIQEPENSVVALYMYTALPPAKPV